MSGIRLKKRPIQDRLRMTAPELLTRFGWLALVPLGVLKEISGAFAFAAHEFKKKGGVEYNAAFPLAKEIREAIKAEFARKEDTPDHS